MLDQCSPERKALARLGQKYYKWIYCKRQRGLSFYGFFRK
jgi:hypothetical protein